MACLGFYGQHRSASCTILWRSAHGLNCWFPQQVEEAEEKLRQNLDPYIDWVADRMEPVKRQLTFDTLRSSASSDTQLTKLAEALKRKLSHVNKQGSS